VGIEIALKECNESEYWLELLHETNSISEVEFKSFQKECIDLRHMLVSSVTTLRNKLVFKAVNKKEQGRWGMLLLYPCSHFIYIRDQL